jgi:PTS system nitrogen regulatory IIA component
MNTVARLLLPQDILLDVDVANKPQLFEEIGRHMERAHAMPQEWVVTSLDRREKAGSTGLGEGVAIPHARVKELERIQAAYFRLKSPIFFNAPDNKPVSDILVLLVPQQAAEEHLTILADAARMFSSPRFRDELHACHDPLEVKQLFTNFL